MDLVQVLRLERSKRPWALILRDKETLQVFVPDDLHGRAVAPLLGNPALSHSKKRGTI